MITKMKKASCNEDGFMRWETFYILNEDVTSSPTCKWGKAICKEFKRTRWPSLIAFHNWIIAMKKAGWLRGHHDE
jgi:hypothetical protein